MNSGSNGTLSSYCLQALIWALRVLLRKTGEACVSLECSCGGTKRTCRQIQGQVNRQLITESDVGKVGESSLWQGWGSGSLVSAP